MWTVADLDALPDDGCRYEILHGELLALEATRSFPPSASRPADDSMIEAERHAARSSS